MLDFSWHEPRAPKSQGSREHKNQGRPKPDRKLKQGGEEQSKVESWMPGRCRGMLSRGDPPSLDLITHYAQKCRGKEEDWTDWVSSGCVHSISPSLNAAPPQQVHANVQDGDEELIRFVSSRWSVRGFLEIIIIKKKELNRAGPRAGVGVSACSLSLGVSRDVGGFSQKSRKCQLSD